VNELELIRRQIAVEQQHASEVAAACADPDSHPACLDYLRLIAGRWRARARAHARRLQIEAPLGALAAVESAAARCDGEEASAAGSQSINSQELMSYAHKVMSYLDTVGRLDTLAASRYTLADWRDVAGIDADAVLEERRLYAAAIARTATGRKSAT